MPRGSVFSAGSIGRPRFSLIMNNSSAVAAMPTPRLLNSGGSRSRYSHTLASATGAANRTIGLFAGIAANGRVSRSTIVAAIA
jgi:hypothetical protein